jgi:transcriptional regulator with XRE-family HTH domain
VHEIESGKRRVTVDELCALALLLDVSILSLLDPGEDALEVGTVTIEPEGARDWLAGARPLESAGPAERIRFIVEEATVSQREERQRLYAALRVLVEHGRSFPQLSERVADAMTTMVLWEIATQGTVYGRPVTAKGIGWRGPAPTASDLKRTERSDDA